MPTVRKNVRRKRSPQSGAGEKGLGLGALFGRSGAEGDGATGGVSHNAVMNWVLEEVAGKALALAKPAEVALVEADELWTY